MAKLEIDNMEYSSDALAQAAYVTSDSVNLSAFSEPTIKTQGNYSLKGIATTSALSATLTKTFTIANDLTNVKDLKFNIRSSRTGSNIKLGLYSGAVPTGGTITTDGGYTIHTFTSDGTFYTFSQLSAEVLVVGGGGGGGDGGGGAGGLIYETGYNIPVGNYPVTVGDGGAEGVNGEDSIFNDLIAVGGGTGGKYAFNGNGNTGGSGGGAFGYPNGAYNGGTGTTGQGNAGGLGWSNDVNATNNGGGGGAGASGENASESAGGNGGDGLEISITGVPIYYAGGGGGGYEIGTISLGGLGGGGNGGTTYVNGSDGTPNTGSGGGGSVPFTADGGSGGSGIVIIKYPIPEQVLVSEITPNITTADQWQSIRWNISNISNINKSNVDVLKITITNADAENTFYIDNFNVFPQTYDVVGVIE